MILFSLLFAHFLADLPLQGEFVAKNKGNEPLFMIGHCWIWTGMITLVLLWFNLFTIPKLLFLFFGHYFMDSFKCRKISEIWDEEEQIKEIKFWIYFDQLVHLGQLFCVYYL